MIPNYLIELEIEVKVILYVCSHLLAVPKEKAGQEGPVPAQIFYPRINLYSLYPFLIFLFLFTINT